MPPPVAINFIAGSLPVGLKGTLQDIFNAFVDNLQGYIDPSQSSTGNYLPGQVGGTQPRTDVGPWLKGGTEWWFYDPASGTYKPQEDALPVGGIIFWGGGAPPRRFLTCNGGAVPRAQYNQLFNAVGTIWGAGDGNTTFNLPPSGLIWRPCNPATEAINGRGGASHISIAKSNLPPLDVTIHLHSLNAGSGGGDIPSPYPPGNDLQKYPVNGTGQNAAIDVTNPYVNISTVVRYV